MNDAELEQSILRFVGKPGYKPAKPRAIAQKLGLKKDQAVEVRRAVKRLVRRGQVAYGSNHLVRPVDPRHPQGNRMVGTFQRTSGGYGFVRPTPAAGPGAPAARGGESPDVYIPAKETRDAATGDVVVVQLRRARPRDPGPRGEIVEVLERQTHQFVGTYFESAGSAFVRVDGTLFSDAIYVGDPGAKGVREGDKVVIEMVRFPSPVYPGEAVITEILGPLGKPGVDTLSILREFNLPGDFAEDALEEARQRAREFDESIPPERTDFTTETVVTIDPADARDFDDAISLERLDSGHWLLGVHIADVSHFVRPRTALDREARERATSVYLPDRVIPMLPEVISNSLASLQPRKVRYTKSALIELTAEGQRVGVELCSAAIKSNKRLNYEQVDEFLADPGPWRKKLGAKVFELLGRMQELAMILRSRRVRRGALELSMPELKIELDRQGRVTGARVVEHTESHQIIEEFMLAANEAVANLLAEREWFFLRRVHESPDPRKLKTLTEFVRELGLKVDSLQSRFELQTLLDTVRGRPEEHAVNYAVLRSMQQAHYSPVEEGHYGLASECYCHFTSPIRRYPDLTVHRLIDAHLSRRKPRNDYDELVLLGQHCSDRERRAETAERELTKLKLLSYLSERIGEEMDAVVTGVESFGLFVQGLKLPAEGLVHVESLSDDYYRYDRAAHSLVGHRSGNAYRLGDVVRVAVSRVDLQRRELDFRLAGTPAVRRTGRAPSPPPERPRGGQKGRGRRSPERTERRGKGKRRR